MARGGGGGGRTFGLVSTTRPSGRGRGTFRKRGGRAGGGPRDEAQAAASASLTKGAFDDATASEDRFEEAAAHDDLDAKLGFERVEAGPSRQAWLVNMHPTIMRDTDDGGHASGKSAVDFYFIDDDASSFKVTVQYQPYLLVGCRPGTEAHVEEWMLRKFEGLVVACARERKEDLKLPNHLVGHKRTYVKLTFHNVHDLLTVRRYLLPMAQRAQKRRDAVDTYADVLADSAVAQMEVEVEDVEAAYLNDDDTWKGNKLKGTFGKQNQDPEECIVDLREYDVPYYLRVAIDNDIRVGMWYDVGFHEGAVTINSVPARVKRAEPVVLAFDIETTKQPLKFPVAETDCVMMISYMIDGQGFLITNREIVSEDISNFEYSPKKEYEGPFVIYNEANELALLQRFFAHFQEAKPRVVATYNGDSFDFPFLDARAKYHGLSLLHEIGFALDSENEYKSRSCAHMDCFRWVKRDSYLPQGSQGLKAVTVAKLGYDPMELDPELMTPYAIEQPQTLAQYSVSDAVATYYLYMKYVHPFVFSLCNIIPLNPDEVLRKGSGTLCETLLMVEAFRGNIVMPNRHTDPVGNTYEGHLLESETYVGGHVEALEAGVFRSDIATDFKLDPSALQQLIDDLDAALQFSIRVEGKMDVEDITNYDEVKAEIQQKLEVMRDTPVVCVEPLIYHLDVAAMYPNIMLSNRLQPDSVVDEATCATCDYNRPGMTCDKKMEWAWRGEYFPPKRDEVNMIRSALTSEMFPGRHKTSPKRTYYDLSPSEQSALLHKRLGDYSRKVYRKTHDTKTIVRTSTICQRENPFYIDTVRAFRDRRYEYKGLHKTWKKNLDTRQTGTGDDANPAGVAEARKMIVLYDSMQLAHKCILNSFYGYVMRKGARWYSMEMAGITCLTGAKIIQMAKELVDRIGRPLELDTDGIWCMLPGLFPENFAFKTRSGKKLGISYPCTMLNYLTHERFTNHQYHTLTDPASGRYEVHSENSIFFELDGPYRAMILPSSKEEDKLLKKRYAVFEHDGSLAELKGFEVKRRGELQLIKDFQTQIFKQFLLGSTLQECYAAVASVADQWLDILFSKGATLYDDELIDLIAENKSMSRTLAEYGDQKSTAITTAKRLAEFLGAQMVKDKGLACKFIVSAKPFGAPVTERAVPVAIFNAEPAIKQYYLRKFLRDPSLTDFDLRSVLDWDYYIERFGGVIQKLITIPAAMQKVPNPVPRIRHPDWLFKRVTASEDKFKQRKLTDAFQVQHDRSLSMKPSTSALPLAKPALKDQTVAPVVEVDEPVPDLTVDYRGWVRVMKKKWAKERRARAQQQGALGGAARGRGLGTMNAMLARRSQTLATATWDVVQISGASTPGEFRLWISVAGQLQSLKLHVPRQFYINFKKPPRPETFGTGYLYERVSRTLPRGRQCLELYRITVSETMYLEEETHFSSLLNHPNVDGVFEMQVPLSVRAHINLGGSCAIASRTPVPIDRVLDAGISLHELSKAERPSGALRRRKYLDGGRGLRYFWLYHAQKDTRHFIGLVSPEGQARVHVVDTAGLQQLPRLEPMYAQRIAKFRETDKVVDGEGVFDYADALNIETRVHTTPERAFRAVARELSTMRTARQGGAVLVINSSRPQSYYEQALGGVASDFPIMAAPSSRAEDDFPALNWQIASARRMFGCYLRLSLWLQRWLQQAEHFDLPFCNIERDFVLAGADIDFARRLLAQDMVLWWSSTPSPDLGGREEDAHAAQRSIKGDEEGLLEISRPGLYSRVVLEIAMRDLAMDAVLQSGSVNDMEGTAAGSMAFDTSSHNLDEYAKGTVHSETSLGDAVLTSQVFTTVKAMVKAWFIDKVHGKAAYSGRLADNFWRWVSTPESALFEPALKAFLQGLMRKTLLQLLAEFKRLGASIVFASPSRLFLLTSKPTGGSAAAYGRYLLSAVASRDLFKHLQLAITNHWELLLWMDEANFGGVISPDPNAIEPSQTWETDMNWNVQEFLPRALRQRFAAVIGAFLFHLYENKRRNMIAFERTPLRVIQQATTPLAGTQRDHQLDESAVQNESADMADPNKALVDPLKTAEIKAAKDYVNHKLTRQLLRVVAEVRHEYQAAQAAGAEDEEAYFEATEQWSFPDLPGRLAQATGDLSPALEFVKTTMAVLGLAKDLNVEVGICRRNLLELLGVREFAAVAEWRNPCESFKLPMVICSFCNDERTLDLTRDADLMPARPGEAREWQCACCKFAYDRSAIEARLVSIAQSLLLTFALQDLRCNKCGGVRANNMAPHCSCSGTWGLTVSRKDTMRRLTLMRSLARYHALHVLESAVEPLLANT
ncbi:dna polymerase catalytic subunit a [Ceraceosorus bombacis]|uniref:DNA polymerase epsilon catalytic subunit n=1 Tax=Ceraceosorus bombacis TaxID=401625 RepID=A0A0P1BFT9_9BASI|nr:dna polymerase catalytic subunit a [Ceraceosorus bombacis]